jgi:ATP-binding cassette subfamily C protein
MKVSVKIKMEAFDSALEAGRKSSDVLSFLNNDFKLLENNYYNAIFSSVYSFSVAIASFIYLISLNLLVGTLFVLFSFVTLFVTSQLQKSLENLSQKWTKSNAKTLNLVKGIIFGRNSVLIYGAHGLERRTSKLITQTEGDYQTLNIRTMCVAWVEWLLSVVSYILPISVGIWLMATGTKLSGADLLAMFLASDRVVGPLRNIGQYQAQIKTTEGIRKNLSNFQCDKSLKQKFSLEMRREQITIQTIKLAYQINPKVKIIVGDIQIPFGSKLLISGQSGIGKTTLLRLILGFTAPSEGSIVFSNQMNGKSISKTQGLFSLVDQKPFMFTGTIAENLTLLHPGFTTDNMNHVLSLVGLDFELGSNALNYYYSDEKDNLSGGQKQRVCIARALLFARPVIICDEITAALDNRSAQQVRRALYSTTSTVIEVAHHFDSADIDSYQLAHYELKNTKPGIVHLLKVSRKGN